MRPVSQPDRGFTLIELLVVIALVAILAAILFPIFAWASEVRYDPRFTRLGYGWPSGLSIGITWPNFPASAGSRNPQKPLLLVEVSRPSLLYLSGDLGLNHSRETLQESRENSVFADGHARFARWVDPWFPENRRPLLWQFHNPRQPVDIEAPCTPSCAAAAARD